MECWVPLFQIFMNSASPETEASLWLQHSFNQSGPTTISTSSFLSLLSKPTDITITHSISPSPSKRVMWMRTLPNAVQARVFSFLLYDRCRFCEGDLCQLAETMLKEARELDFWVKRAAQQLLDAVSPSNHGLFSCPKDFEEKEQVKDEFMSLPDWLKDAANDSDLMLPWLPMASKDFNLSMQLSSCGENVDPLVEFVEDEREIMDDVMEEVGVNIQVADYCLNPQDEEMAGRLKDQLLCLQSTARAVELAEDIRHLCKGGGGKSLALLGIVELWRADDETAALLISNLLDGNGDELGWPSHLLCSIILPKLLVLKEPASRVLLMTTIEYCKVHQRAAEHALLLPLLLRKEGINTAIADVVTRIVRESLHPGHVAAFFQKLLCDEDHLKNFICLPSHECLISTKLVWTESLFSLMQNILNHSIHLTQDSVDRLVQHAWTSADMFSKSLKFGNFLLCFVTKCAPMLKSHKSILTEAAHHTNTLVTKSMLSKLSDL